MKNNTVLKIFLTFILVFGIESVVNLPLLPLDDVAGEKYVYIPTSVNSKGFDNYLPSLIRYYLPSYIR